MGLYAHNDFNPAWINIATAAEMAEITLSDALSIARNELKRANEKDSRYDLVIDESSTQEYPFGWVIEIAPRKYLKTRDPDDMPPGVGSYIVDRDGTIDYMTTAVSPSIIIEFHLKEWLATHPH
jgi:hypothetical protein